MVIINLPVHIDDEIYPLVKALNDMNLRTMYSCSGHSLEEASIVISMENIKRVSIDEYRDEGQSLRITWNATKSVSSPKESTGEDKE